jgi:hypothetical protein
MANEDDVGVKQNEVPPYRVLGSPLLYEIVTFTVLILGVSEFARTGGTTLIYIACTMATAQAGQPIARNLLLLLKEKFLPGNTKKDSGAGHVP